MASKEVYFTRHALDQMRARGATVDEVQQTIDEGECLPARDGRATFRKNYEFDAIWKKKTYRQKQVMPIVVKEPNRFVVITVYVFYFGGEQ